MASALGVYPLAVRVSVGFPFPTVHGFDLVRLAKERIAAGGSERRTIVRVGLASMASVLGVFPLAVRVSVGFPFPTVHGFDLLRHAKEKIAAGGSERRTIVRVGLASMASVLGVFPLAVRVSVGFTFPTVHGFELVGRAKERVAAGGSERRTIVRVGLASMASVLGVFPLAVRVSVGFTFPTVHGFELVGRAKERVAAGSNERRTIVRMASFPWLCQGTHCIRGSRLVALGGDVQYWPITNHSRSANSRSGSPENHRPIGEMPMVTECAYPV